MKDGKEILESIWSSVSIEPTYYSEIGFTEANYLALPVLDTEDFDISVYFESATRFIDSALNSTETSSSSEVAASTDRKQRPLCVQASSKLANTSKVVIHCAMGISRSATIVIAYLLMRARDPFPSVEEAMRFVRTRRSICPNDGFLVHLFQLESRLQSNCQQVKSSSCIEVTSECNPQPTHVAVDR